MQGLRDLTNSPGPSDSDDRGAAVSARNSLKLLPQRIHRTKNSAYLDAIPGRRTPWSVRQIESREAATNSLLDNLSRGTTDEKGSVETILPTGSAKSKTCRVHDQISDGVRAPLFAKFVQDDEVSDLVTAEAGARLPVRPVSKAYVRRSERILPRSLASCPSSGQLRRMAAT
jgi:hypothetical protein